VIGPRADRDVDVPTSVAVTCSRCACPHKDSKKRPSGWEASATELASAEMATVSQLAKTMRWSQAKVGATIMDEMLQFAGRKTSHFFFW